MFNLNDYINEHRVQVDDFLEHHLPGSDLRPTRLHEAMRYSMLSGGKRLRPILCMAAAKATGGSGAQHLLPACAIELLHTYTLIHDDLPAMDDDKLRRGRPTSHVAYDEATAILAGDALLTLAFEWLAESKPAAPYAPHHLVIELATAAGSQGVVGGQVEDLAAEHSEMDEELLRYIHLHKTAALFKAAVAIGAQCAGAQAEHVASLRQYGCELGLAFQLTDDVLDETATDLDLGKTPGKDKKSGKLTGVRLWGLDECRRQATAASEAAVRALSHLPGPTRPLEALARFAVTRTH